MKFSVEKALFGFSRSWTISLFWLTGIGKFVLGRFQLLHLVFDADWSHCLGSPVIRFLYILHHSFFGILFLVFIHFYDRFVRVGSWICIVVPLKKKFHFWFMFRFKSFALCAAYQDICHFTPCLLFLYVSWYIGLYFLTKIDLRISYKIKSCPFTAREFSNHFLPSFSVLSFIPCFTASSNFLSPGCLCFI